MVTREKVSKVLVKIAKSLDAGEITEADAKISCNKLAEILKANGKTKTASAIIEAIQDEVNAEDAKEEKKEDAKEEKKEAKATVAVDATEDKEAEGINSAVKNIYQKKNDFVKLKNKRVRDVFPNMKANDIYQMKFLPFLEMIANMTTK